MSFEMKVLVVGKGERGRKLLENVERALRELGIDAEAELAESHPGVAVLPALVVNGRVLLEGETGPYGKLKRLLERACGGS